MVRKGRARACYNRVGAARPRSKPQELGFDHYVYIYIQLCVRVARGRPPGCPTIPYHTIPYHAMPYHTILYYPILYTILYYTELYSTTLQTIFAVVSLCASPLPAARCPQQKTLFVAWARLPVGSCRRVPTIGKAIGKALGASWRRRCLEW